MGRSIDKFHYVHTKRRLRINIYNSYCHHYFSNKAVLIQGKSVLNTVLEEIVLFDTPEKVNKIQKSERKLSNRIFIVHGSDEEMKQAVARILGFLNLEPVILHEQPDKGRTIIEKFSDYSDVSFAVVLLSPDDFAYSKDQAQKNAKLRARQNVIFELGFFIGKLGRKSVLVLHKEDKNFEMPSDYSGVLYTPYKKEGNWPLRLAKELQAYGYDIVLNKLP